MALLKLLALSVKVIFEKNPPASQLDREMAMSDHASRWTETLGLSLKSDSEILGCCNNQSIQLLVMTACRWLRRADPLYLYAPAVESSEGLRRRND